MKATANSLPEFLAFRFGSFNVELGLDICSIFTLELVAFVYSEMTELRNWFSIRSDRGWTWCW